jgi:hypothetical protein
MNPRSLTTPFAVALATCALAPAAAMAGPIIDGQGIAAGGGPGVNAKQFEKYFDSQKAQSLTAPDQVDRVTPPPAAHAAAPAWPNGPQPAATRHAPATAAPANDGGGIDTGVWIAIGGASLIAVGAAGAAGRKRVVIRKRQPA